MPVTTVADVINLLASRRQGSILHDRRTGMPYSWSNWLRTRASRAASAFATADMVGLMGARAPAPASGVPVAQPLWWIILAMFWHGGDPPPRDQRRLRWFAGFFSAALHVLFALLLLWVALVRSNVAEESGEQGERVQVEYIGRGTPEQEGGGTPASAEQPAAQQAQASAAAAAQALASPDVATSEPAPQASAASASHDDQAESMPVDASKPVPVPTAQPASAVAVEQPLQVTEAPQPTRDFVLPQTTVIEAMPRVQVPQVRERSIETATETPMQVRPVVQSTIQARQPVMPEVQVRERQVETAQQQTVTMARTGVAERQVQLRGQDITLRERDVQVAPNQSVAMAQVRAPQAQAQIRTPALAVRERQLPGVADAAAASAAPAANAAANASSSAASPAPASATASASASTASMSTGSGAAANRPSAQNGSSAGAGPKPQDRSGGWDAQARADDWGASTRQVAGKAGGQADQGRGLFNADGSVRLAGEGEQAARQADRGAPGGDADTWSRERIAESGTWLKRPPYEFTPTSFDKYWVPNESLLAEWVRKGIKDIKIPIPGTNTSISCVVSMLQFGGGCSLSNPNMQEQPAEARPPPDIPFKKALQEDNGSR
ncbi:hypothetical protein [Stenotrophomonas sp.]|uniref:hypothetical protein n=1 Tax=Stenotrophomonas sp. TaxID=69392 RepID=UPI0028AB1388|nr:hypothetical protein [Stenotrophomonas sp.]